MKDGSLKIRAWLDLGFRSSIEAFNYLSDPCLLFILLLSRQSFQWWKVNMSPYREFALHLVTTNCIGSSMAIDSDKWSLLINYKHWSHFASQNVK